MPIGPGTSLGPYDIQFAIGAGGMGEVYWARDNTKLGRDVAIKVLPDAVAFDEERVARFIAKPSAFPTVSIAFPARSTQTN